MIKLLYSARQIWCYNQTSYIQLYGTAFLPYYVDHVS